MTLRFGEKLRALREARGLSQRDLAMLIGKAQDSISYWERSGAAPSGDKLAEICRIFGVSADYLVGLEDEDLNNSILPPIDLIALLRSSQPVRANGYELSKEAREAIASTVEAFASLIGASKDDKALAGDSQRASKEYVVSEADEDSPEDFDPHSEALRVCARYRIEPTENVVAWLEQQIRSARRLAEAADEAQQEAT